MRMHTDLSVTDLWFELSVFEPSQINSQYVGVLFLYMHYRALGFCSVQLNAFALSEPCDTKCASTWMMRTHRFMEIVAKLHMYLVDCGKFMGHNNS